VRPAVLSRRVLALTATAAVGLSVCALPGVALADDEPVGSTSSSTSAAPSAASSAPPGEDVASAAVAAPTGGEYRPLSYALLVTIEGSAPGGTEYSLDGGTTWVLVEGTRTPDSGFLHGDLGMRAAPQGVLVRNVDGVDRSQPTALDEVVPLPAPTGLTTSVGPAAITMTWTPPAATGSYPLGLYEITVSEIGGERLLSGDAPAGATSATIGIWPGASYEVTLVPFSRDGYPGPGVTARTPVVPAHPATTGVPTRDDGDVTGAGGPISTLVAGQRVTLRGDGFLQLSTVQLTLFSTPTSLGTVDVGLDGAFAAAVTIPAGLANGTHHLVASGLAPDGSVRNLVVVVTVSGGRVTGATLANTGFDAVPVAVGGGLVLLTGAGLLLGARRRAS
jgi:hypothetical protein